MLRFFGRRVAQLFLCGILQWKSVFRGEIEIFFSRTEAGDLIDVPFVIVEMGKY